MSQCCLRASRSPPAAPSVPGYHTLPSCHPWQRQASNKIGSQCPQGVQMGRAVLTDWEPRRKPLLVGHSIRDAGEVHCFSRLWPRLVEGLSEGYGGLQHLVPSVFPGPPAHPLAQVCVSSRASRMRAESASYLSLLLMTYTPPLT